MDTSVYPVLHVTPWDPGLAAKRDSSERLHKEGKMMNEVLAASCVPGLIEISEPCSRVLMCTTSDLV